MKSLKRTLSLVLALVMVLGLFGGLSMTASASDFTDDESIQYKEAVDVMTGIGAINGMDDGTFSPKAPITRAQAAKLVTYTVLGKDAAERLPSGVTSSFSDVGPEFAWAAPSIEYLVKQGVINGLGDGTFNPGGYISGYAVTKMLLCALGYGAKGEYTDSGWEIPVAIDASKYGIIAGRAKDANILGENASREEVALYCFNTIQAGKVRYLSTLDVYVPETRIVGEGNDSHEEEVSIKDLVYSGLAKDKEDDALGNPATTWRNNGVLIGEYPSTPVLTYMVKKTEADLRADLKNYTMKKTGSKWPEITIQGKDAGTGYSDVTSLSQALADETASGTVVKIYANSLKQITDVTVTRSDVAKIAAINEAAKTVVLDTVTSSAVCDQPYKIDVTSPFYELVSGLAVDDYVVVTPAQSKTGTWSIANVEVPTQVSGKITQVLTATDMITMDGTEYALSAKKTADAAAAGIKANGTHDATIWRDSNGFVVHYKAGSASNPFFYFITDVYDTVDDNNRVVTMAHVVYTDGSEATIRAQDTRGANNALVKDQLYVIDATKGPVVSGGTHSGVVNGVYMLKTLPVANTVDVDTSGNASGAAVSASATVPLAVELCDNAAFTAGDKQLKVANNKGTTDATKYINNIISSDVKFVFINDGVVTVKTGVQPITSTGTGNNCYATIEYNDTLSASLVTAVFLPGVAAPGDADPNSIVYLRDQVGTRVMEGSSTPVPLYDAYVNGEHEIMPVTIGTPTKGFFTRSADPAVEGAWAITAYTPDSGGSIANTKATSGAGTLITVGGNLYEIGNATIKDCRPEETQQKQPVTPSPAGLAKAIAELSEVKVSFIYDKAKNASMVFIEDAYNTYTVTASAIDVKGSNVASAYTATITTSPAREGATVTVKIAPTSKTDDTSKVDTLKITATDADGHSVTLSKSTMTFTGASVSGANGSTPADDSFTFTMPANNVTISCVVNPAA